MAAIAARAHGAVLAEDDNVVVGQANTINSDVRAQNVTIDLAHADH